MGVRFLSGALAALALCAVAAPAAAACKLDMIAALPVTMYGLRPMLDGKIEDKEVRLFADTGGFFSMLSPPAVERLGLKPAPGSVGLRIMGVTGEAQVRVARAKEYVLSGAAFHDVDFLVGGNAEPGVDGFLGQNILGGLDAEFDLANGVIRFFKGDGCETAPLAYWDDKGVYSELTLMKGRANEREIDASAAINGEKIRVILDTGSPRSILTLSGARRAGVSRDDPGATAAGLTGGVGHRAVESWIVPVKSFSIGGEEIKNTRVRIGDIQLDGADMLLGADFFLSHRIFVARSQRKIYFTYNGGPVFRLDRVEAGTPASTAGPSGDQAAATPPGADEPKTAGAFVRRGAAFAARGQLALALKDYDRAVELEPKDPQHYFDRAQIQMRIGHPDLALENLDQTLKLKPDFAGAAFNRAVLRLRAKDLAGAKADFDAAALQDPQTRLAAGAFYVDSGQYREAVGQMDAWIAAHPKDPGLPQALNNRCWARALGNFELEQGLVDCDAAVKAARNAGVLDSRGLVRLRLGRYDDAIADYNAALKLQPKEAWSLYGRGLAKLRKGLKAEGEADLKAAGELAPGLPDKAKAVGLTP